MDHPLIGKAQKDLRQRVVHFMRNAFFIERQSNIVFVCGGNKAGHMRKRFQKYFKRNLSEFEFFEPEFAMKSYFSEEDREPFNIAEFEELVGELSHSIVLFPEAPGSFAETGYFSATKDLAEKTILVVDSKYQSTDGFISLGPARKIEEVSRFHPLINIPYKDPDFVSIANRIKRYPLNKRKKTLQLNLFSDLSAFELFSLIKEIVSFMTVATLHDLLFILRSMFNAQLSETRVRKITSILVGSKHLVEIGRFGHLAVNPDAKGLLDVRDGKKNERTELLLSLADIYQNAEPEFLDLVMEARDAA